MINNKVQGTANQILVFGMRLITEYNTNIKVILRLLLYIYIGTRNVAIAAMASMNYTKYLTALVFWLPDLPRSPVIDCM